MQYVSNTQEDRARILKELGVNSFDKLIDGQVPASLRNFELKVPKGISELELVRYFEQLGAQNKNFKEYACYLGAGNYDHFVPAVVDRLALRGEFITAYTPYQGEASQGTLQSIYEYQSLMCDLTAMDYSNASMYDGASSLAEAVLLAIRSSDRTEILIPETLHPEYKTVIRTYLANFNCHITEIPSSEGVTDTAALKKLITDQTACVVVQQPNFFGVLEDAEAIASLAHQKGALVIACVNPISLGVIAPPGEYGADIAVGEGQPLGNSVSFGGPHFGFFCVKEPLLRKIPGRIAGMTVDKEGRRAFVLTLQAREQHIRREKATSNICTNQALCALKGAIYLSMLGQKGLRKVALLNIENAHHTYERLLKVKGVKARFNKPFFNEFALEISKPEAKLRESFSKHKIIGPLHLGAFDKKLSSVYLFAVTENRSEQDLERLIKAVEEA